MLIPSMMKEVVVLKASLSRRVNANSQPIGVGFGWISKLIKKGEC